MQKKSNIKRVFDDLAKDYWLNSIFSFGWTNWIRKKTISKIVMNDYGVLLDIMCGTGNNFKFIKQQKCKRIGIDFSGEMLKIARHENQEIVFIEEDFLYNSIPDNSIDYCICTFSIKQFTSDDYFQFVSQLKRILKSGGSFAFAEINLNKNNLFHKLILYYIQRIIPILNKFITHHSPHQHLYEFTKNATPVNILRDIMTDEGFEVQTEALAGKSAFILYGKSEHTIDQKR